jgi:hypothetical protein
MALRAAALSVLLVAGVTAAVQAQFEYIVNSDNTITITAYAGASAAVTIPSIINGLAVTTIGAGSFDGSSLSSVIFADSVTNIGQGAFEFSGLTSITIPASVASIGESAFEGCAELTNATIPKGITSIANEMFLLCGSLARVTIASSVTNIGEGAFWYCGSLTNVTIPGSVTSIGTEAFNDCSNLSGVFFTGNPPTIADSTVFGDDNSNPVIYYLEGTDGWSSPFATRQALLWNPQIQTSGTNFGVQSNQFGFNITGTPYIPVVVEACTNLASPVWIPLQAFTLTNGLAYFSEILQTDNSGRYYRISSP